MACAELSIAKLSIDLALAIGSCVATLMSFAIMIHAKSLAELKANLTIWWHGTVPISIHTRMNWLNGPGSVAGRYLSDFVTTIGITMATADPGSRIVCIEHCLA